MSAVFKHSLLDDASKQIRLLNLQHCSDPNNRDDDTVADVHCTLTHHDIATAPDYIAVSYTWGDPTELETIYVNGLPFRVRRNCWYVLVQARIHAIEEPLWIDAICINQDDIPEKSTQVAMIGGIFQSAIHVNMCLGPHSDNSEHLFNRMAEHSRILGEVDVGTDSLFDPDSLKHLVWSRTRIANARNHLKTAGALEWFGWLREEKRENLASMIRVLLRRPYFTRIWVVQEIFLARYVRVLCGHSSLRLLDLYTFYYDIEMFMVSLLKVDRHSFWCEQGAWYRPGASQESAITILTFGIARRRIGLHRLSDDLGDLHCEDIRDRIVGLLHAIDWLDTRPIIPDYSKHPARIVLDILSPELLNASRRKTPFGPAKLIYDLLKWLDIPANAGPLHEMMQCRREGRSECLPNWFSAWSTPQRKVLLSTPYFAFISEDFTNTFSRACLSERAQGDLAPPNQQYLQLFNSDRSRVYVPASCRRGDILGFFGAVGERTALVLRKENETSARLRIIGQAVFEYPQDVAATRIWSDLYSLPNLVMQFGLLDCVLWICQSISNKCIDHDSAETLHRRFCTPVCDPEDPFSSYGMSGGLFQQMQIETPNVEADIFAQERSLLLTAIPDTRSHPTDVRGPSATDGDRNSQCGG